MKKKELFKQIKANVLMYHIQINDNRSIYDKNGNYVKPCKKRDIIKYYLEFGREEAMSKFKLTLKAFNKMIDGIGYVPYYNSLEGKYDYMQTEDEMFGFKCSVNDLSESELKIYNSL